MTVKFCPAWDVVILGGTKNWKILSQSKNKTKGETKSWQIDGHYWWKKYFQFQPFNFIVFLKLVQMKASLSLEHSNKVLSLIVETWDGLVDNLTRSVSPLDPHLLKYSSNFSMHKIVWHRTTKAVLVFCNTYH